MSFENAVPTVDVIWNEGYKRDVSQRTA